MTPCPCQPASTEPQVSRLRRAMVKIRLSESRGRGETQVCTNAPIASIAFRVEPTKISLFLAQNNLTKVNPSLFRSPRSRHQLILKIQEPASCPFKSPPPLFPFFFMAQAQGFCGSRQGGILAMCSEHMWSSHETSLTYLRTIRGGKGIWTTQSNMREIKQDGLNLRFPF